MKNDINLLYKRKTKTYSSKKVVTVISLIVLFAAGLYAGIAIPSNALNVAKIEAAELESKLNSSTENQQDLTSKAQKETLLIIQANELNTISKSRNDMSRYIEAIEMSLPVDANITQLLISDETVNILGNAKDDNVIATFCLRLREQNVFKDVYLTTSSSIIDDKNATATPSPDALNTTFAVTATLPSPLSSISVVEAIEGINTASPSPSASPGTTTTPAPEVTSK